MITFTIATCTYNAGNELPPTLQSVLEQDYPYVEHLIIDGASKDNTMSLLEDYKRNKETKHSYAAKTDCLLVRGDFNTFFCDSSITQYFGSPSGNGF